MSDLATEPRSVYLDHHATTPCDPRVLKAMLPCFSEAFGNASSLQHTFGQQAAAAVEKARHQVAELIACEPAEIVWTSGASESDNLALKGVAEAYAVRGRHLVTAATEHRAVLDVCSRLERRGFEVTYLAVGSDGRVDPQAVRAALRDDTVLVSLMLANNEIGVLHPLREISEICRQRGVLVHTDAAQALAWEDCRVDELGVDLLSISGHKLYGPKGVGALYVRRRRPRVRLVPRIDGGGHEKGRRSGTLNVPGIVGLGKACELILEQRRDDAVRVAELRDLLLERLRAELPGLSVNGCLRHRLPNNLNVALPGISAERLVGELSSVALSAGAACSDPGQGGSYVLRALAGHEVAETSLRIGLGRTTRRADIEHAATAIVRAASKLSEMPEAVQTELACDLPCAVAG